MFTATGVANLHSARVHRLSQQRDDKDWQGDSDRGLEQGLFHVLSERAKELSVTRIGGEIICRGVAR